MRKSDGRNLLPSEWRVARCLGVLDWVSDLWLCCCFQLFVERSCTKIGNCQQEMGSRAIESWQHSGQCECHRWYLMVAEVMILNNTIFFCHCTEGYLVHHWQCGFVWTKFGELAARARLRTEQIRACDLQERMGAVQLLWTGTHPFADWRDVLHDAKG